MANRKYIINQNDLLEGLLPQTKQQPIIEGYMQALLTPMTYLNNTVLNNYIYGSTYSYYSPTGSYTIGSIVNGGINYGNGVYELIATASGTSILTSSIYNPGYGYNVGDYFNINGGVGTLAIGKVLTTHSPSGFKIDITSAPSGIIGSYSLNSGGSGYAVADRFYVSGGFTLAAGIVVTVGVGGNVTAFSLLSGGTGYVTGSGITTIMYTTYTGKVLTYAITNPGNGYIAGSSASTTFIIGAGTNLGLNILTVGGIPPPSNTSIWQQINNNFIGVDERDLYIDQELTLTWALNRWFNTNFNQPNGVTMSTTHSDIYINDLPSSAPSTFVVCSDPFESSSVWSEGASEGMCGGTLILVGYNGFTGFYNIMVPSAVLNSLPNGSASVAAFVNKYNYTPILYNVIPY